jgi:hypothetical protein
LAAAGYHGLLGLSGRLDGHNAGSRVIHNAKLEAAPAIGPLLKGVVQGDRGIQLVSLPEHPKLALGDACARDLDLGQSWSRHQEHACTTADDRS